MEKLQRFSIRKLSIGAVSCLIGTVAFLGYSRDVQAAETPQTVETAKAGNEIQAEKAQENKQNEEASGDVQNRTINKDAVESQKTDETKNDGIKPQNLLTDEEPDIKAPAKKDQAGEPTASFPKGDQKAGEKQQNVLQVRSTKFVAAMKVAQNLTDDSLNEESQNKII